MSRFRGFFGGIVVAGVAWLSWACGNEAGMLELIQPTDSEITDAVAAEYLLHPTVDGDAIEITTHDGVVTLTGSVGDMLAERKAVEIVEATRGVRSLVDRINVNPPERSDEAIRSDAVQGLLDDPATESYEVDVSVEDGVVTMSGSVDSWVEKELAYEVVAGVRGVRSIDNLLTIEYESRGDVEVKEDVVRRLESDVLVDAGLIVVEVNNGRVNLSGTVGSLAERRRAVRDAFVTGVREVVDDSLEVEWWARDDMRRRDPISDLSDEVVQNAVIDAHVYDPRVLSTELDVTVSAGLVTLKGVVGSMREKNAAIEDAQNTYGVWEVIDSIEVVPDGEVSDAELQSMVRDALQRDPYVEGYEIVVEALNGIVYLTGTVNNLFEKIRAEFVVSNLHDVVAVESAIEILPTTTEIVDEIMEEQIRSKVTWNPWLAGSNIALQVSNGVVSMSGTVDSRFEMHLLERIAAEVGAKGLELDLEVTNWPSPPNVGVELSH